MKYWRKTLDRDRVRPGSYDVHVLKERCKGCGFCIDFCPRKVLHESAELNAKGYRPAATDFPNQCSNCGFCERICPEFAVSVVPREVEAGHAKP